MRDKTGKPNLRLHEASRVREVQGWKFQTCTRFLVAVKELNRLFRVEGLGIVVKEVKSSYHSI